ncbi:MaoC family dehydratase N-terminal domain-containing protein [Candidatus Solirubrobacter pratensis]|uniref:MaoC family dehydratase N-terminal domain-containing protein n=1 Tax=Candidatus Solirubrobacter pratensis TaxID=1298857 RepID=UPI000413F5C4|nr:MaoC family dehydratase N-terminal domain-containing protein [Candidatus Solirubrobacter pratensis]
MSHSDTYLVGREKVREYAAAIGETSPLCHDVEAARAAGYADVVAPPMFAAVYAWRALGPVVLDPQIGVDFERLVHGGQEFAWHEPVVAGDEITTEAAFVEKARRADIMVYTFSSRSTNQRGELVCEGTWTNFVR